MLFSDREEAGRLLGEYVRQRVEGVDIVLGIPRGGVVVAKEVAKALGVSMGLLLVRKLGVPFNSELAFGAIDPDGHLYLDHAVVRYFRLSSRDIQKIAEKELGHIRDREKKFGGLTAQVENRAILVVDDGIATGQTMLAGVEYLKRRGARKIMVAAPVCHKDSAERLRTHVDGVYCYHLSHDLPFAVGMFYRDFRQVEDAQLQELLRNFE
ncbi:MAG: phosphoribosyltransferase family protein [Aquificaceae bacterium]|nr:phosphoribosyltransferase family protein [Aquificaceae bacterium]MCX8059696.1 phosphoribosyltransferase family protein [Aquificaceae bacterium]MDW8096866.1 phosphoribosyltransferase family protein [Aquificaceae bacterium]